MEIADLLSLSGVRDDLKAGSKKQALQELSAIAAAQTAQDERTVLDVLLARERLGSTGVGAGVAIPHGKLDGLTRLAAVFARLREPIAFDAIDERPVDLVFLLLAPENASTDHLKALALVSRLLRDERVCARLRGADSAEALYAVLTDAVAGSRA
jgi:PTS system nitrogen regulatory IIA component